MSKIKQQQFYHWQNIIPQLKKNVQQCLKELRDKTIKTFVPDDYDFKKNKIKTLLQQEDSIDFDQYLEVFAFMLEEKINVSLLELADQFRENFGKDAEFWVEKIIGWANMMTFTNTLVIWTVNEFTRNFVNYYENPLRRDLIYQWRPKAQAYLTSVDFLIRKIQKIKKTDSAYILDESYFKHHKEKVLYLTFVSKLGLNSDQTSNSHDQVTITYQNKSKAQKKLFNFPNATKTLDCFDNNMLKNSRYNTKKASNTLQKYNFVLKNSSKNSLVQEIQIPNYEQQRRIQHDRFLDLIENIGRKQFESIQNLRQQLRDQKEKQKAQFIKYQSNITPSISIKSSKKHNCPQPSEQVMILQLESFQTQQYIKCPLSHLLFIHSPTEYFEYIGFPVAYRKQMSVAQPYKMYPWVNYYINDREEYDDLMAVSLDGSTMEDNETEMTDEDSQQNDFSPDNVFIDRRAVVTYDEYDENQQLQPEDKIDFGLAMFENHVKWVADRRNTQGSMILDNFLMIPLFDSDLPYRVQNDQARTKGKIGMKSKQLSETSNFLQQNGQKYEIQQILENSQQDNQTTNYAQKQMLLNKNKIQRIQEKINTNRQEKQLINKFEQEQTTFVEHFQEISVQIHKFYKQQPSDFVKKEPQLNQYSQNKHIGMPNSLAQNSQTKTLKSKQPNKSRTSRLTNQHKKQIQNPSDLKIQQNAKTYESSNGKKEGNNKTVLTKSQKKSQQKIKSQRNKLQIEQKLSKIKKDEAKSQHPNQDIQI